MVWRRWLVGVTVVVALLSVAAQLGGLHWAGDVSALFTEYYFWVSLLLVVGFWVLRSWRWMAVAVLLLLLNAWPLLPYVTPVSFAQMEGERDLRLMVHNIYYLNRDPQGVVDEIEKYNPDVIFLMEYSDTLQAEIEPQLVAYPHRLIQPSSRTMGLALFSRIPLEETRIYRFDETRIPIFYAEMHIDDQPVRFVGGHPWPPLGRWGQLHREQVAEISGVAAQSAPPLIVAGDFNASIWSSALRNLARAAGVEDARRGFGLGKTWHLLPGLGLSLDHILVSPEWTVLQYMDGEPGGSDHVPLIVDLQLP